MPILLHLCVPWFSLVRWETVLMRSGAEVWLLLSDCIKRIFLYMDVFSAFQIIQNYVHASLYPRFINYLGLYRQTETPSTYCCALYAGTTKQLHQGCHLESAFPRPPLSQWLMKLCLISLEIIGKMWISELFNLFAKFSPVLLKLRQICLERFLLLPATRVVDLKDIRCTSKWKTTS